MRLSNDMIIENGYLLNARQVESPNFDSRPSSVFVDLIVIHSISLPPNCYEGEGILKFFTNQLDVNEHPYYRDISELKVSSHILIRRNGEIIQFVNFDSRAWHAGKSKWKNKTNLNKYSLGIEIQNKGHQFGYEKFTKKQISALIQLLKILVKKYKIKKNNILGHSDIAPLRKIDPGENFPWKLLSKKGLALWYENFKFKKNSNKSKMKRKIFFRNIHKIFIITSKNT